MTAWLLQQISDIISSVCLYNTPSTTTLGSNKKPRISAAAANVCRRYCFQTCLLWGFQLISGDTSLQEVDQIDNRRLFQVLEVHVLTSSSTGCGIIHQKAAATVCCPHAFTFLCLWSCADAIHLHQRRRQGQHSNSGKRTAITPGRKSSEHTLWLRLMPSGRKRLSVWEGLSLDLVGFLRFDCF